MRLATFVNLLRPQWRAWVETLSALIVIVFVLLILSPSWEYITNQWLIATPALELHDSVRVAAIGVGAALMMLIALVRLAERSSPWHVVSAVAVLAGVIVGMWLLRPVLVTLGNINLIIFFVGVVMARAGHGCPDRVSFGAATLSYLAPTTHSSHHRRQSDDEAMSTPIPLSVPLFVFWGR